MAGPLKTLFTALVASSNGAGNGFLQGVTVDFGEEALPAQDRPLPRIVMVPIRGNHGPGYATDGSAGSEDELTKPPPIDVNTENLWEIAQQVQFYLWSAKLNNGMQDPTAQPVDHADAVETLRLALLSALQDQTAMTDTNGRVYNGLAWKSLGEEWETMKNAVNRFGRALVVTVQIDVPVVMSAPTSIEQTVETTEFDPSIASG